MANIFLKYLRCTLANSESCSLFLPCCLQIIKLYFGCHIVNPNLLGFFQAQHLIYSSTGWYSRGWNARSAHSSHVKAALRTFPVLKGRKHGRKTLVWVSTLHGCRAGEPHPALVPGTSSLHPAPNLHINNQASADEEVLKELLHTDVWYRISA